MANIADDLTVHVRDTEEHDKNLRRALQRLTEKQITLTIEKCTFRIKKSCIHGFFA